MVRANTVINNYHNTPIISDMVGKDAISSVAHYNSVFVYLFL